MNRIKILLIALLTTFLCVSQALADAIPDEFIGDGKWVTLKTGTGYYFCAIKEGGTYKLGQSNKAPTESNYAAYCWKISGNSTDGYKFRCLGYMDYTSGFDYSKANDPQAELYITNPTTIETNSQEVLLTTDGSEYFYTDTYHQLQLKANTSMYLAYYSVNYHTIRLHNSGNYGGSYIAIGGIYDWSVAAVVLGTETEDSEGRPQGTYLPAGGVSYNSTNYLHGASLTLSEEALSHLSLISITGYKPSTIKIDRDNRYVVAYYVGDETYQYKNAETTHASDIVVTGENNTIWTLNPKNYITNSGGSYNEVPANKAWQMEMVVQNTNTSGNDPSFNQWGSCILSSTSDPFNTYYWGNFQIYQHAPTHSSPNTLNFKSSKADGNNHIIAQGHSVANKSYKVIVQYNGSGDYVIRTIMLDNELHETQEEYNNVWVSAMNQVAINHMSCALPQGINIKSLKISIAEESNLFENQNYAIQNKDNSMYLSWDYDMSHKNNEAYKDIYRKMAGYWAAASASKCQIVFTNSSVNFDGLHRSFYIKTEVWNGTGREWKFIGANNEIAVVDDDKKAFIYVKGKIVPVEDAQNPWGGSTTQWTFDMFANFLVQVEGNSDGAIMYKTTEQANNTYCEFPVNAQYIQYSNKSIPGYTAAVVKENIALKVTYTALTTGFYEFEDHRYSTPVTERNLVYYWDNSSQKLVSFAKGTEAAWDSDAPEDNNLARGDAHQFTVTAAMGLPVVLKQNTAGDNKYYSSIYVPRALNLPNGVKAYYLKNVSGNTYILQLIEGSVLPASTAAVLISDSNPEGSWTFVTTDGTAPTGNLLSGSALPLDKSSLSGSIYVLSGKDGIGFYPYTAEKIPAFKAYHQVTAGDAKMFTFTFDDDITGITDIEKQPVEGDDRYYDLSGRQITTPVRGHIYIHNGVKVLYK